MITPGLVSVTFRSLSPEEIIHLVQQAGLEAVEWGGDVHVPHGNLARAREVSRQTINAGLRVCAYGSYYRVGANEDPDFEMVLSTALALGAPLVRVWAGRKGSHESTAADWERIVADSIRICNLAAREGLAVAYEFHRGTLTDTNESARRLLELVDHPALRCYWQPPQVEANEDQSYRIKGLELIGPWLANLHVFHWIRTGRPPATERCPLAEGEAEWSAYLRRVSAGKKPHCALLEFVRGDRTEQFLEDAAVLQQWLARL